MWKWVWVFIIWCLWKHRNEIVFNQAKVDASEIFSLVQVQSWNWLKNKVLRVYFSFSDWVQSSTTCIIMTAKRWSLCGLRGWSFIPWFLLFVFDFSPNKCAFCFLFLLWFLIFLFESQYSPLMWNRLAFLFCMTLFREGRWFVCFVLSGLLLP